MQNSLYRERERVRVDSEETRGGEDVSRAKRLTSIRHYKDRDTRDATKKKARKGARQADIHIPLYIYIYIYIYI